MEDKEPTLVAGYRLDRYELLSPIASGGMASVWLARLRGKRGFEKLFAIKTIKTELTQDPRFQEMFLDEARIASGIQHPNVAHILDLGEQDDVLYIVMEWVDGESVAKIRRLGEKKGTPLPLGVVLRVVADTCAGLHAAHELRDAKGQSLGVVHRDVSPQNVLVSAAGSVKVIDFGVAKARDRFAGETQGGIVKGKIRYMAPEQAQGHPLDRRADVWAVGVCLHELVTGVLPFDGDSDVDVLRRLMGDEPPPRPEGAVPDVVQGILDRSLVRDPEQRFATAAAMQRAIDAAIAELGLGGTNEDVADFLRANLPELETKRRDAVTRTLAASEAREAGKSVDATPLIEEAALAATVISQAGGSAPRAEEVLTAATATSKTAASKARADAPKKAQGGAKKKRPRAEGISSSADDSKVTLAAAAVSEALPPPAKKSGAAWWVLALGALAAGAWFVWPGGERLRATLGSDAPPEPSPAAAKTAEPARSPVAPSTAKSAITAAASADTSPVSSAAPSASADAGAALDAGARDAKAPWPRAPGAAGVPAASAEEGPEEVPYE